MNSFKSKIQGCILGAAVGDGLGFIVEKKTYDEAQIFVKELKANNLQTFKNRTYPHDFKCGQYSDDTQFSIILIELLLKYPNFSSLDYLNRLAKEYSLNKLVGIGGNTKKIFEAYLKNQLVDDLVKNSSNGALMRSWVVGLFFKHRDELNQVSHQQSKTTHDHPESILSCQVIARSVNYFLRQGSSVEELRQIWDEHVSTDFLDLQEPDFLSRMKDRYTRDDWEFVPPGAMATLEAVLYSVYHNSKFEEAIYQGISFGGDTDSVASLIGALMGIRLGSEVIPKSWINQIYDPNYGDTKDLVNLSGLVSRKVKN